MFKKDSIEYREASPSVKSRYTQQRSRKLQELLAVRKLPWSDRPWIRKAFLEGLDERIAANKLKCTGTGVQEYSVWDELGMRISFPDNWRNEPQGSYVNINHK